MIRRLLSQRTASLRPHITSESLRNIAGSTVEPEFQKTERAHDVKTTPIIRIIRLGHPASFRASSIGFATRTRGHVEAFSQEGQQFF